MSLSAGYVINARYRVDRLLGSGANGEVYEVFDVHRSRSYALKLLNSSAGHGGPWHEAQVLTSLRNDFILPVHNADFFGSNEYLVTELATRGTVYEEMGTLGVEVSQAIDWTREACRGVAFTHMSGLLHCDIKPENLFLSEDGTVLLGDFSLAAFIDINGQCRGAGTPWTTAPEMYTTGVCTPQTEVYSLGASLYAMLAGRFAHPPGPGCRAAVTAGSGPSLVDIAPHVPRAVARVVEDAMNRDPTQRIQTPEELDAALGRVTLPERRWIRTDAHAPTHARCWTGQRSRHRTVELCEIPSGTKYDLVARYAGSGIRVANTGAFGVTDRRRPVAVRGQIRKAD